MPAPQRNKELPKPVNFDQLYPGRFMKSGELLGEKRTFTIKAVAVDEVEGDKGKKVQGFLEFKEVDRHFLLNKTNGQCLKGMFGKALSAWEGKRITIYPDSVQFGPEMVDGMRIWGSPDIKEDMTVIVTLPRRKPIAMKMHKVDLGQPARANTNAPAPTSAPSIADYETCATQANFDALEVRRQKRWTHIPTDDKPALKAASDAAKQRLAQPSERTPYVEASAIAALNEVKSDTDRAALMSAIVDDFDARNEQLPLTIDDANQRAKDRIAEPF